MKLPGIFNVYIAAKDRYLGIGTKNLVWMTQNVIFAAAKSDCVTVAQQTLTLFVLVRIQVGLLR